MRVRKLGLLAMAGVILVGSWGFAENLLKNGSFAEGSTKPAAWSGSAAAERDTQVYASAPASLKISSAEGVKEFNCLQGVRVTAGHYRVRGKMKAKNVGSAGLAMVVFAENNKQTGWNEVAFTSGTADWGEFDLITYMPEGTKTVSVMAFGDLKPEGTLWLDDLSMERVSAPTNRLMVVDFYNLSFRRAIETWVGHIAPTVDGVVVSATCKGKASLGRTFDISGKDDFVPVLTVKSLPGNEAKTLQFLLLDEKEKERIFTFSLPEPGSALVAIPADNNATLSKPNGGTGGETYITSIRLQSNGDEKKKLAVLIRGLELVAPGQPLVAPVGGSAATQAGDNSNSTQASAMPAASSGTAATEKAAISDAPVTQLLLAKGSQLVNLSEYGAWMGKTKSNGSELQVLDARSDGGCVKLAPNNLTKYAQSLPAVSVRVLPGNQARTLLVLLKDTHGKVGVWEYDLKSAGERPSLLLPRNNANLSSQGVDLTNVREIQFQGNFPAREMMSLAIDRVEIVKPRGGAAENN